MIVDQDVFAQYLKDRYHDQIAWYDHKAATNQRIYGRLQWSLIILAAMTPVLIELDLDVLPGAGAGYLAVITSILVAILTAALKTFKYQENWIAYRTTCETLRKEVHFHSAGLGDYRGAKDKEALFVDRVESLISRENTMWVTAHKAESGNDQNKGPIGEV